MKSTLFLIIFMWSGAVIAQWPPYVNKLVHLKVKLGDTTLMQKKEFREYKSACSALFKFDSMYTTQEDENFFATREYNVLSIYAAPLKIGTFTDTIRAFLRYYSEILGGVIEDEEHFPVSIEVEGTGTVFSTDDKSFAIELAGNTISVSNPSEKFVSMELVDLLGRRVVSSDDPILDLPNRTLGLYFILIRLNDEVVVKKIFY